MPPLETGRRLHRSADLVEFSTDPQQPFLFALEALECSLAHGDWVLAFNALVLAVTPLQAE